MVTRHGFVYVDENYPSNWIPKGTTEAIVGTLTVPSKGREALSALGAEALQALMTRLVERREADTAIVVFAQDIVPETVFQSAFADCIVRRFLDRGGTLLWMGDIPFWYLGRRGKHGPRDIEPDDGGGVKGAFFMILGVKTYFAFPTRCLRINLRGRTMGLKTKWSGQRPVRKLAFRGFSSLAIQVSPASDPGPLLEPRRRFLRRLKSVSIGGVGAEIFEKPAGDGSSGTPQIGKYASAWYKNFNRRMDGSGIYRIWDYEGIPPDQATMSELEGIVRRCSSRRGMYRSR